MYDELYELLKKEKEILDIQRLPKNFYSKVASYIKKMNEENRMLDKKTIKAKMLRNELEHSTVVVAELLQCRYEKFLKKALAKETVTRDTLTDEEKRLYGDVLLMPEAYQAFSKNILRGQLSTVEKGEKKTMIVLRFIQEIPALIGADLKTYGPFSPEDIATLPHENARILIKKGLAMKVDSN